MMLASEPLFPMTHIEQICPPSYGDFNTVHSGLCAGYNKIN